MPRKKVEEQAVEAVVEEPSVEVAGEKIPDERALIFKQIESQYLLPWKEQANLIRSMEPLTESGVKLAVAAAMSYGLPLSGINLIPSKAGISVYINATGVQFRLMNDKRGVKKAKPTILHRPSTAEPWWEVEHTIIMGDDSEYSAFGSVDCVPGKGAADALLKSETKAYRRCGKKAVSVDLPLAEDFLEFIEEQQSRKNSIEGSYTEMPSTPKKITDPKNLAEFFTWVTQSGHTMDEVTQIIGDASTVAQDVPGAVKKLKEVWNEPSRPL